jgi:hypothetical protein
MTQQTTDDEAVRTDPERPTATPDPQTETPPPDPHELRTREAADPTSDEGQRTADERQRTADAAQRADEAERPADDTVEDQPPPTRRPTNGSSNNHAALFSEDQSSQLRSRWETIQASFVDEPQSAVKDADALVEDVMRLLSEGFDRERQSLEGQWSRGDDVSTEELRLALRRYRSLFDRLLPA